VPSNASYYHLAYAVATGIYVIYAMSLAARWNRAKAKHVSGEEK